LKAVCCMNKRCILFGICLLFATSKLFINTNLHSVKHHVLFSTSLNYPNIPVSINKPSKTCPQKMTINWNTPSPCSPQPRPSRKECSASASICGCGSKASASSAMGRAAHRTHGARGKTLRTVVYIYIYWYIYIYRYIVYIGVYIYIIPYAPRIVYVPTFEPFMG